MKVSLKNNRNRLKNIFFIALSLFLFHFSQAQYATGQGDFWSQVRYGGGIGIGFFNGNLNASIAPSAIYPVSDDFAAGVSLNLNYAKFNDSKFLAYGGSLVSLYNPIPQLQVSAELEQLRVNRTFGSGINRLEDNYWSPALFMGLGFTTRNVTVGLRYNVLFDESDSIYADALMPFVRFFF
ncbi:alpha-ketoglutarate decarboxylase [Maribacter chungangensis]|uniref:Alpha-ketoglutarate decarboxylase n=1 Tax=Maribacter chungangensis TaxID=1069117 RepID=A0ABW3B0V4_9FLAO